MSQLEMLTSQNSAIAPIDYQPAMYQGAHDRLVVVNNIQVLAKAGTLFKIPSTPCGFGPFRPRRRPGTRPVSRLAS
jgi:hypothetical protein